MQVKSPIRLAKIRKTVHPQPGNAEKHSLWWECKPSWMSLWRRLFTFFNENVLWLNNSIRKLSYRNICTGVSISTSIVSTLQRCLLQPCVAWTRVRGRGEGDMQQNIWHSWKIDQQDSLMNWMWGGERRGGIKGDPRFLAWATEWMMVLSFYWDRGGWVKGLGIWEEAGVLCWPCHIWYLLDIHLSRDVK